jgi:hypothetical protein
MSPKDLFAVLLGAIAVWLTSIGIIAMLATPVGTEFAHLIVGVLLLTVAGFVWRSGPWTK